MTTYETYNNDSRSLFFAHVFFSPFTFNFFGLFFLMINSLLELLHFYSVVSFHNFAVNMTAFYQMSKNLMQYFCVLRLIYLLCVSFIFSFFFLFFIIYLHFSLNYFINFNFTFSRLIVKTFLQPIQFIRSR